MGQNLADTPAKELGNPPIYTNEQLMENSRISLFSTGFRIFTRIKDCKPLVLNDLCNAYQIKTSSLKIWFFGFIFVCVNVWIAELFRAVVVKIQSHPPSHPAQGGGTVYLGRKCNALKDISPQNTIVRGCAAMNNVPTIKEASRRFLTPVEASAFLGGLNSRTVTRWAREGYLPAFPVGEGTAALALPGKRP